MPTQAVLMGDLNFTVATPEYDCFVGPMSRPHGRLTRRDGFVDAWVVAGHDEAEGVTSPSRANGGVAEGDERLDYCFVSAGLADRVVSSRIDSKCAASDHLPLWVELNI